MKLYENMLILKDELEEEEKEKLLEAVQSTVQKGEGRVEELKDWGRRKLAYPINDLQQGHYYLLYFYGQQNTVEELEHFFKVSDEVLRFMIVRAEESQKAEA